MKEYPVWIQLHFSAWTLDGSGPVLPGTETSQKATGNTLVHAMHQISFTLHLHGMSGATLRNFD